MNELYIYNDNGSELKINNKTWPQIIKSLILAKK